MVNLPNRPLGASSTLIASVAIVLCVAVFIIAWQGSNFEADRIIEPRVIAQTETSDPAHEEIAAKPTSLSHSASPKKSDGVSRPDSMPREISPQSVSRTKVPERPKNVETVLATDEPMLVANSIPKRNPEVGRPFPLSDSVREACKQRKWCIDLALPLLAEFAGERREPNWAPLMEAEIGRFVAKRESDGFSLRVVECRTSLCVVEVYSPNQKALLFGGIWPLLKNLFLDAVPEATPTYGEGKVTIGIFRARKKPANVPEQTNPETKLPTPPPATVLGFPRYLGRPGASSRRATAWRRCRNLGCT